MMMRSRATRRVLFGSFWLVLCVLLPQIAHAAPGDLVRSFGFNGVVETSFEIRAMVRKAADGSFIAGGCVPGEGSVVARFLSDGSPDGSFGVNGSVPTQVGTCVFAVSLQSDGKIVVAAEDRSPGTSQPDATDYVIARFTPAGFPDLSFGSSGQVVTDVSDADIDNGGMVLDGQGRIVVVGGSYDEAPLTVLRYLPDGSLDPSFGGDGIVRPNLGTLQTVGSDVLIQGDGKIVVAVKGFQSTAKFIVLRLKGNGNLDSTFGSGGIATLPTAGQPESVAIRNGKIVAAGHTGAAFEPGDVLVARFQSNGSLDPTFGVGGIATTNAGGSSDVANDVLIQPDGKVVVVGRAPGAFSDYLVIRYRADGLLDSTFGGDGIVTTDADPRAEDHDVAYAVVRHSSGRLTVGGSSGMARYIG